ncbi:GntR family transcriptional regulator [Chelativorans composti]|uniref:GntR family transcriptional regulator n=1 Tax=Chelativorans composti TaxID=768533 RepID=A0ABW5DIY9_9HYPH
MEVAALEKSPSLSDRALERLTELIIRGDIKPGARIQEAVLARQLGISRGPLREAIRRLEGRGLLVRIPNVGVHVANPTVDEIIDLYTIREVLEGLACRLAAERLTDKELKRLRDVLFDHSAHEDVKSGTGYYQSPGDQDFHFQIIKGSRQARLIETLLGDLYQVLRFFRYRSSIKPGRAKAAFEEHISILEALERRDGEAAERLMREHLQHARLSIQEAVDIAGSPPDA